MYRNDYFVNLDYVQLFVSTFDKKLWGHPQASIWLKKKGGRDYRKNWKIRPDEFMKFKIPEELKESMIAIINDFDKYNLDTEIYNRYQTQLKPYMEETR